MKTTLLYSILAVVLSLTCLTASAQTVEDSLIERIEYYAKVDSFVLYYESLHRLDRLYISNGELEKFKSNQVYFQKMPATRNDSLRLRYFLSHRGNRLKKHLADMVSATSIYEWAHKLLPKDTVDRWLWYIENPLANLYARQNDFDQAIYFHKMVIPYIDEKKKTRGLQNLGSLYLWVRDTIKAVGCFKEGLQLSKKLGFSRGAFTNLIALSNIATTKGEYTRARENINQSKVQLEKLIYEKDYSFLLSIYYTTKAELFTSLDNLNEAIKYNYKARESLEALNIAIYKRSIAKINYSLAEIYFNENELDTSKQFIKKGLINLIQHSDHFLKTDQLYMENTLVDLLFLKSKIYFKEYLSHNILNSLDTSLYLLNQAVEVNDLLHQELIVNNSKLLSIETNRKMAEHGIKVLFQFQERGIVKHNLLEKYFEKSKNINLSNAIDLNNKIRSLPFKNQKEVENLLVKIRANEDDPQKKISLYRELNAITNSSSNKSLSIKKYRNFLDFLVVDKNVFLFTDIGSKRLFKLKSIESKIGNLNLLLAKKYDEKEIHILLNEIFHDLIPIEIAHSHVNILPDGYLCLLPFELLRQEGKYWFETTSLSYQYSKYLNTNNQLHQGMVCLVPSYSDKNEISRAGFGNLKYTKNEADNISNFSLLKAEIKYDSIEKYFFELSEKYSIIHYAGHAKATSYSSYIALEKDKNIKKISAPKISQKIRNHTLVTLSACESGLGEFKYGEGVESLARSFLSSGVSSVVYSLWTVNDRSTSELMHLFYSNLYNGERKDKALQNAKLQYLEKASPEYRHPYYWAGFVLSGSPDVINIQRKNITLYLIIPFIILLIIIKTETS